MLKKIALITTSLAILALSSNANAEISPYVSAKAQYLFSNQLTDGNGSFDLDNGPGYGISGGAVINNNYRAELELFQQKGDTTTRVNSLNLKSEVDNTLLMVNGFYDFKNSSQFTPYVGAGIGAAKTNIKFSALGVSIEDDATSFAFQAMTGVSFDINKNNSISLGYRFVRTANSTFNFQSINTELDTGYESHALEVGYRFTF